MHVITNLLRQGNGERPLHVSILAGATLPESSRDGSAHIQLFVCAELNQLPRGREEFHRVIPVHVDFSRNYKTVCISPYKFLWTIAKLVSLCL